MDATYDVAEDLTMRLPFASTSVGGTVYWDLRPAQGTPHFLAVGRPGTGKTELTRRLVQEAAVRDCQVRVCTPRRADFTEMDSTTAKFTTAAGCSQVTAAIEDVYAELDRRYGMLQREEVSQASLEPIILAFDDYQSWGSQVIPGKIGRIAALGRAAAISLLITTRSVYALQNMRSNFDARCSLGQIGPTESSAMWGTPVPGSTVSRGRPGRSIAMDADGSLVECQVVPSLGSGRREGVGSGS